MPTHGVFAAERLSVALWCIIMLTAMSWQSLAAVKKSSARLPQPLNVLFIGNSHLFVNNVPARVRGHLLNANDKVSIKTFAKGGARLVRHANNPAVRDALQRTNWSVVVLQESSAAFLSRKGRQRFHEAVNWFVRNTPSTARIVLYQTWPWRAGSRFLRRRGANPSEMWRVMQLEYAAVARQHPHISIAPVGPCWMSSSKLVSLYSPDGNHASVAGSELAAAIIADTIKQRARGRCSPS